MYLEFVFRPRTTQNYTKKGERARGTNVILYRSVLSFRNKSETELTLTRAVIANHHNNQIDEHVYQSAYAKRRKATVVIFSEDANKTKVRTMN